MAQVHISVDLPTYEAIKRHLERIDELKTKWPNDYKDRCGYVSAVDRIIELLPYAFR